MRGGYFLESNEDVLSSGPSPWITLFTAPTRFFEARKGKLGWLLVTIIVAVITAMVSTLDLPYVERSPGYIAVLKKLTSAQITQANSIARVYTPISSFIGVFVALFLLGFLLWIVIKLVGGKLRYMQVIRILANANVIALIGTVLALLATMVTGTLMPSFLSVGMFIHTPGPLQTIGNAIGVFPLWMLYVEICGISVVGEMTKQKAAIPVIITWVLMMFVGVA